MKKMHYPNIDETIYYKQLENGLKVYMLPKTEFNKTYAVFTTLYGSIDQSFQPIDQSKMLTVPDGIAHFLEHKLFESETGDAFLDFAKNGANANAFTSFTRTSYLFSATNNIEKNLLKLLDFVQEPYFTEASVEKEKGIIAQEIKMYEDNPGWRLYFGIISNMYHIHPVRIDIAGTVESIQTITPELLHTCYQTFYHPSNMILFLTGNIDHEETLKLIESNQFSKTFIESKEIKRHACDEPREVLTKKRTLNMDVHTPKCLIGIKGAPSVNSIEREICIELALDVLFSKSGDHYQTLFDNEYINDTFSYEYNEEDGYSFALIGGDTFYPNQFHEAILEILGNIKISKEQFERAKRRTIGILIKSLNSLEYIANQFTNYQFKDVNLFELNTLYEQLNFDTFNTHVDAFFDIEHTSVFQVLPNEE